LRGRRAFSISWPVETSYRGWRDGLKEFEFGPFVEPTKIQGISSGCHISINVFTVIKNGQNGLDETRRVFLFTDAPSKVEIDD
jgi:hypothetical protein